MEKVNIPITLDDSGFSAGAKKVINRMEEIQKEVDKNGMSVDEFTKHLDNAVKFESLKAARTRLREMSQQIVEATLQYRSLNEEERKSATGRELERKITELTRKAGALKDAMEDANREISGVASDTAKWDALGDGLNVAASALGGIAGAASMLGAEEQELQRIQTALQASLATSNALSVIQNKLQKESTLMLTIRNIQEAAAAKAITMRTLAEGKGVIVTKAATVAQKALNIVAKANPYILLFTAITTLVGGVFLLNKSLKANADRHKEAAEAARKHAEEIAKMQKQWAESVANSASQQIVSLRRLQSQWNALGDDMKAKQKFVKDNQDAFNNLGFSINSVSDAENILVNNTDSVVNAIMARAKAAAYAEAAKQIEGERIREMLRQDTSTGDYKFNYKQGSKITRESLEKRYGKDAGRNLQLGTDFTWEGGLTERGVQKLEELEQRRVKAARDAKNQRISVKVEEAQKVGDLMNKELDNEKKSIAATGVKAYHGSTNGRGGSKGGNGKDNSNKLAAQRIQLERELADKEIEAQRAAREAVDEAYIAGIKDDYERERAQEEFEHKKRLADIERKGEEMKKARYEANKKQWELENKDKHYETDSAEGMKGWQGVSLSGNELVSLNAELAKENAEYERAARERAESLVASHQSYTDRKLAIDKQYSEDVKRIDAEIAAAQAHGDNDSVAALQRSKRQAATDRAKNQSALSLDILKESPEYIRAFEDLEQTSSETLEYLIEEFEKAKQAAAQSLDPKDLKEYTDTIQRMQDEISSRNPFKTLKKSMDDLRKSEKNVKEAKDRLNLAKQKVKAAKDEGKSIEEVKKAENEEAEAQKKYNEAQDDHLKKQKKVKDSGKDAAEVFSKIGEAMNQVSNMIPGIGGEIAGVVSDVAGLATSLITALTFTAEGATAAIRAVESASVILAVISAALQVVQGIMSLLGNKDGYENAKAQYDELVKIWDELIDKKREYLNESWGNEVKQAKKEAEELLKIQEEATRVLAQQRLDVKNGSHSMWYRMWQGSYKYNGQNWQDVAAEIEKELGVTFNGMNDMTLMTAEQLEYIKGKYSGLWAVMDSDFRDFMEKIISYGAKEEEILEDTMTRITGNNYDDIYDNFMDSLYEIADGSEDVMDDIADNWQEMINRMVVNNVVGTRVKEELKSWYQELYNLQDRYNDHQMTDSAYEQELERLRNSYNSIVTSSQQEIENFRQMGIIKTLEETAKEVKKYFEDILDSWKDTLTDMESTTEDWKNALIDQIFSDLVESTILNAPLTVAEKTYENFEKYLQDWTERYKNTVEDATLSDEERNRRLRELIDEQTALREQQAEKSKQLAESIGKDMSEAISNSLDNLGDSLIEGLLANSEADAENAGKQIALTLIKEMLQMMLASEKYKGRMEEIRNKWQQLLNGEDVAFTMDDVLQDIADLNNDIANDESISALAQQYKELNKQVENTQTVFNDLHNTFLNTLTDMKGDAESFRKTLEQTMLKDFIDKQVLDVPITVNGMDFDDFNAYVEDWNKRYAEEVKAGNMEAVDALLDELMQVREMTLSQAEDLRKRLEESMHELGEGFNNLREQFVKTLTNIVGDAESLGKEIGQSMMEQMLNAFVEKQYSDRINAVNEEWAKALEEGDPQRIDEIRQKVINLYETISSDRVVKQLSDDIKALTDTGTTPFDNLRSSYLAALTDMNKSTEDFTKEISQMIAQSFVDSFVLGDMFDDRIEAWKKKYKDITTDAGLSEEERMKQLRGLSEMIAAERESMQGQVSDIYKLLGINDHQDQEATMSLAEAATYDQFELYLGIATAQQIDLEQGNSVRQQILSTLQSMGQITSPTNPTLLEMRNMFSTANEYLLDIKRSNRDILNRFSVQLDSINAKLRKL